MLEHQPEPIAVKHTYHYQELSISNPLDFGKDKFKEDIFMSKYNWKTVEKSIASEIIGNQKKVSKTKDVLIIFLSFFTVSILLMKTGVKKDER